MVGRLKKTPAPRVPVRTETPSRSSGRKEAEMVRAMESMEAVKGRGVIWEFGLFGEGVLVGGWVEETGRKKRDRAYKPVTEELVGSPRSRMMEELSGTWC